LPETAMHESASPSARAAPQTTTVRHAKKLARNATRAHRRSMIPSRHNSNERMNSSGLRGGTVTVYVGLWGIVGAPATKLDATRRASVTGIAKSARCAPRRYQGALRNSVLKTVLIHWLAGSV